MVKIDGKLIIICIVYLFLAGLSAHENPAFVDEPGHLASGYTKLVLGDYRMNTEAPPLMNEISAYPLMIYDINLFENSDNWKHKNMVAHASEFLYLNNPSAETILFTGRLASILLGLLLGIFIYWFVEKKYDVKTARYTFLFYATTPMILAHSSISNIDFGFTFFNIFTFFMCLLFLETPLEHKRKDFYLVCFFILFSLTFMTKFTAIHNFIFYPLVFLLNFKKTKEYVVKKGWRIIKMILLFAGIFWLIVSMMYGFQNMFVSLEDSMASDPFIVKGDYKYDAAMSMFHKNSLTHTLANAPNPFPYYFSKGIGYFLFDKRSTDHSFNAPTALKNLLVKNTVPMILLILVGLSFALFKTEFYSGNFLLYIIFYFTMFGMFGNYTFPRYLLMIYPILILVMAKGINWMTQDKRGIIILTALLILHLIFVAYSGHQFYLYNNTMLSHIFGEAVNELPFFGG